MIGIVIQTVGKDGFNHLLHHKFNKESALNILLSSCLKTSSAHKVIINLPLNERLTNKTNDLKLFKSLNTNNSEWLGRFPKHSYNSTGDVIGGIYQAALINGLDHVLIINSDTILTPSWAIHDMIKEYFCTGKALKTDETVNHIFDMMILPFWKLADIYTYQEDRDEIRLSCETFGAINFKIPRLNKVFRFKCLEDVETIEYVLGELKERYDLADILGDRDGNHKENVKK